MSGLHVIILAAGQGTRMRSALPKVLHPIAGRPMLMHVVTVAGELGAERTHVVYGHGGGQVRERLADVDVTWVEQPRQLGTGHAVEQAMPAVPDDATVLVLYGDVPLITRETLADTVRSAADGALSLITVMLDDPTGYGRILRDDAGAVTGIVEHKDATPEQRDVREGNTGILAVNAARLRAWLDTLDSDNAQGEYYLTDVIAMAAADGVAICAVHPERPVDVLGVNDRVQLAALERAWQRRETQRLMRAGVSTLR